jgi:hypothetical protein
MIVNGFAESVSRLTCRMMALLLRIIRHAEREKAPGSLPAGALHLPDARLIMATTCCSKPLFHEQMRVAASASGADVLLMRHGLHPEGLNGTGFDVLLHVNREAVLLKDLILYHHHIDGFWLVPGGNGPHIALEPDGLRLADEPPFMTWQERSDGICKAARLIARAAQPGRSF